MLGAALFLLLEHYLSALTNSWALILGALYIAFVIFVPEGVWGLVRRRLLAPRAALLRATQDAQPVP
jgi:branched-chain amino acid transport system permease protein